MNVTTNQPQHVHGQFCLIQRFSPRTIEPIRRVTEAWLTLWGLTDLADPCLLVVTELCSNTRHTYDKYFELTVSVHADHLRINVRDHSPVLPEVPDDVPDLDATSGRGLYLLARYADQIGMNLLADGKMIWAEIVLTERSGTA